MAELGPEYTGGPGKRGWGKHGGGAMTATGQRKWRVTVRNFSKMEMGVEQELTGPVTIIDEFNSFDAALELACQKRKTAD